MKKFSVLIFTTAVALILSLGYVDYLTGDYSMEMFYLVAIYAVTWFTNKWFGIICAIEAVSAEALADYCVHNGAVFDKLHYWNWGSDLVLFVGFCMVTSLVRGLVNRDFENV